MKHKKEHIDLKEYNKRFKNFKKNWKVLKRKKVIIDIKSYHAFSRWLEEDWKTVKSYFMKTLKSKKLKGRIENINIIVDLISSSNQLIAGCVHSQNIIVLCYDRLKKDN